MRFPIGARLLTGFLAVIVLVGLIAVFAINRFSDLNSVTGGLAQHEVPEVHLLWSIRTMISGMEASLREFLDHGREDQLVALQETIGSIDETFASYGALHRLQSKPEEILLRTLTSDYRSLQEATVQLIDFIRSGQEEKARLQFSGPWHALHRGALESLERFFVFEDKELQRAAALAEAQSRSGSRMVFMLTVGGALLSLAMALGITRSITSPVGRLVRDTERAITGDLTQQSDLARNDEIGLLARRFDRMIVHLKQSTDEQRQFFADASHELRTPLTVIRGEAEVTLRGPDKVVREYKDALGIIAALAAQMARFVDDLLFLARADAGQIRHEVASVQLAPLLEEIYRESQGLAHLREIHMTLDVRTPAEMWGDAGLLRQLFLTLVDNAMKYTDRAGEICITLDVESEQGRVTVSDTGRGISDEDLPHIFERFYQARDRPDEAGGGTGLGLSIAKSIVNAHHGDITVQSELGRGATFTVLLPCTPMMESGLPDALIVSRR